MAQSAWRYDNTSATYTNSQSLGGNDEWSATDAGDSKTKLPATLKIGTLDKPVFDRTITLKSKLAREQWFSDTAAVVNKIKFPAQKTIEFDNQGHGNEIQNQYLVEGSKVTEPTKDDVGTSDGLTFEGWYTDSACTVANKYDFSTAVADVANKLTLYANWVPSTEAGGDTKIYWISPSKATTTGNTDATANVANGNYIKEEWNVKKSSAEIQADIDVLSDTDHNKYDYAEFQRVKAEYTSFMTKDDYHLFTKIGDGTDLTDYVEFRIIQVCEHDSDGSALTFQATHALPEAVQMNTAATNAGGFGASNLAEELNSGSVFSLFSTEFTDSVMQISKNYMKGEQSTEAETGDFKFWVASYSELILPNTHYDEWLTKYNLIAEGTQYDYFANLGISGSATATNPGIVALAKNRSGATVGTDSGNGYSWERTPDPRNAAGNLNCFLNIRSDGYCINGNTLANSAKGVVPCFALGTKKIVKFDNQNHGNEVETQTLEFGDKVVEPTADEVGTSEGLTFEGWYRDSKCSKDLKWDFDNDTVDVGMTLYANWVPSSDDDGDANAYWLSPSYKVITTNPTGSSTDSTSSAVDNVNYVKEAWNVKKSKAEIKADVAILEDTSHKTYTEDRYNEVVAEYTALMNSDEYHLYTKIGTGDALNDFVEFRIINVGSHDDDGSVLTFRATHSMPNAYAMNATNTNEGGWASTQLRKDMNPTGYIEADSGGSFFNLFKAGFTDDVAAVGKKAGGGTSDATINTSLSHFWLLSHTELVGGNSEGTQYQWMSNLDITSKYNKALAGWGTRAGKVPASSTYSNFYILSRTANTANSIFGGISAQGYPNQANMCVGNAKIGIVPCFAFGGFNVTFDLQGHTATDETTPSNQVVAAGEKVTAPSDPVDKNGELTFAGWYKNTSFADDQKWDFNTDAISENTTLYAYWKPNTEKYWIAPASKKTTGNTAATANVANTWNATTNPNGYNSEEKNIKKSSAEIQADVKVLNDVDHKVYTADKYNEVFEEYSGFLQNDTYHLYTKWKGSTVDRSGAEQSANAYVEFRIIQVGEHDSDGSVLTFQATHTLAPGYQMRADGKNTGGWSGSAIYTAMQSGGDIYNNFSTAFTDDIMSVKKKSTKGTSSTDITTSSNKLWMLSQVEYNGATGAGYVNEGSKYDYYGICAFNEGAASPFLVRNTRAGNTNANAAYAYSYYWTRSPLTTSNAGFYGVNSDGDGNHSYDPAKFYGVVPAFSFGVGYSVKFNGNGNTSGTMADQTGRLLNDGVKLTANAYLKDGYGFRCWNTEADGSGISYSDKEVANLAVDGNSTVTLYAQWVSIDGYWIAPAWKQTTGNTAATTNVVNGAYTNPETDVVRTKAEIQEDVKVLNDIAHVTYTEEKYTEVKELYEKWMLNDSYHLYTKYNGAAAASRGTDDYFEFRIVQVGQHYAGSSNTESDGTALTFQGVHAFATAMGMNATNTSTGGWASSAVRTACNGTYLNSLPGLKNDVMSVKKYANSGYGATTQTATLKSTTDKLWIMSMSEGYDGYGSTLNGEGLQYTFWSNRGIKLANANNYAIAGIGYIRSGAQPASTGSADWRHWFRSANTKTLNDFMWVDQIGTTNKNNLDNASCKLAIVPTFAFGVGYTVKFNNKGGTGTMSDQSRTLNDNVALTANGFTKDGYGFTTWNTEADGSGTSYTDKQVANLANAGQTTVTLYAQWKELKDYWIAPAMTTTTGNTTATVGVTNKAYTSPETGIVKNADDIQEDVKVLADSAHSTYSEEKYREVKTVYDSYLKNDDYHLYTKWKGSKRDATAESALNGYMEARVIQVGGHDSDGSELTFRSCYALAPGYQMNTTDVTTGGWGSSALYTSMNASTGSIYSNFNTGFTDDIFTVTKKTTAGSGSTTIATKDSKMFVLSVSELSGVASSTFTSVAEGSQYYFFNRIVPAPTITPSTTNPVFKSSTRAGNAQYNYGFSWTWTRSPITKTSSSYAGTTAQFVWTGSTGVFNSVTAGSSALGGVVPAFAFGYNVVKFETGDGTAIDDQILKSNATATEPESPTFDGYDFDGWYTDSTYATKFDFTKGITKDTTVYAKWTPVSESYWMTFADSTTPEVNVVKSKSQIKADVAVLKETAHATYTADKYNEVKAEYESFMDGTRATTGSEVHLYTKVGAGTTDDDYAEFRLLQVGEHDTDGSVLTFQMTHVLPDAQAMNATKSNSGGWPTSDLHTKMQADAGEIFTTFKETLTDDIFAPTKKSMNGNKETSTTDTTDKLWALSAVEVYGLTEAGYTSEGSQYDYYANKAIVKSDDTNDVLAYRTRSGGLPDGQGTSREAGEEYCSWWLRTPSLLNEETWCRVYSDGRIDHNYADIKRGVAVAFCF